MMNSISSFAIAVGLLGAQGVTAQFSSAANAFNSAVASQMPQAAPEVVAPTASTTSDKKQDAFAMTAEDQLLLDSFFAEQSNPGNANDYTDLFGSGMAAQSYGLASEFLNGEIERLDLPGIASPGYSMAPMSSYGAVSLSCGLGYVEEIFRSNYIAVSPALYNAGFSCGRCVKISCDDKSCKEPGKQLVATVVDQGGELFDGDLTLAGSLFKELTGREIGANPAISVSWEFLPSCGDYIDSAIKVLVKPGGSAYYQALSFSNSREAILAVMVNGDRLRHESNGYWSWNPSKPINPRAGFDIAVLGANKQVIRARIPTLRSSDLGIQFAKSVAGAWDGKDGADGADGSQKRESRAGN